MKRASIWYIRFPQSETGEELLGFLPEFRKPEYVNVIFHTFLHANLFQQIEATIMKTSRNSRCWVKWAFRLRLGCLYRRYSGFYNLRVLTIVIRYNLGIMCCLSKILIRILPWDPWLPKCSMNLTRSCQGSQDASKRVNPGSVSWLLHMFCHLCYEIERVISKIFQDSKHFFI